MTTPLDRDVVSTTIRKIIAEHMRQDTSAIEESAPIGHDGLNLDSLEVIELGMEIEDTFTVEVVDLEDDVLAGWETVGDIIDHVAEHATAILVRSRAA